MTTSHTLDELERAVAGFAMASMDDEDLTTTKAAGEAVARGARIPIAQVLVQQNTRRAPDTSRGFIAGANTVRDTVYGYLGFGGATA